MITYETGNAYDVGITYYGSTNADSPVFLVEIDTISSEFRLEEANEFSILQYDSSTVYNTGFNYEGGSPFRDITEYVRSIDIQRGRSALTYDHYDAGTATIVLRDTNSTFMPGNSASIHYPYLTTMRPIRIRASWSNGQVSLFRGYVDKWQVDWQPNETYATVTVTATDLTKVLSKIDTVVAGVDGDTPKQRLDAILDAHSIPASFRVLDTGVTTLLQDVTDRRPAWGNMQEIELAEAGALFIDGYGRIVFKNRTNALPTGTGTPITDTTTSGINYSALTVTMDDELLYNFVSVTIASVGTEQTAGDAGSEDEYQRRSLILDAVLLQTDAQALTLAQHLLNIRKVPARRVESVTIPALQSTYNLLAAMQLDLLSPITVTRSAPGGYSFSESLFIVGVEHHIEPKSWDITYATQNQV